MVNVTGVIGCENRQGYYKCVCENGYRRQDNTTCVDINECQETNWKKTPSCHPTRSVCINTVGSSRCECKKPFKGDGKTCSDTLTAQNLTGYSKVVYDENVPRLIFTTFSVPVGPRRFPSFYISKDGAVVFTGVPPAGGKRWRQQYKNYMLRDPCPDGINKDMSFKADIAIFAPYWSAMTRNTGSADDLAGEVFYNVYNELTEADVKQQLNLHDPGSNTDILSLLSTSFDYKAGTGAPCSSSLAPKYTLIDVQWEKVTHFDSEGYFLDFVDGQTVKSSFYGATFRLRLLTNYLETVAIYSYGDGDMMWDFTYDSKYQPLFPVARGFYASVSGGVPYIHMDGSSCPNLGDIKNNANVTNIKHIDKRIFKLAEGTECMLVSDSSKTACHHPDIQCKAWITEQENIFSGPKQIIQSDTEKCPCHKTLLNTADYTEFYQAGTTSCWREKTAHRDATDTAPHNILFYLQCCYMEDMLVTNPFLVEGRNLYLVQRENSRTKIINDYKYLETFDFCCSSTRIEHGEASQEQCSRFLKARPVSNCDSFTPSGAISNSPPRFTSNDIIIRLHYKMVEASLLTINVTDPEGDPVTFAIDGPDWMTIDSTTGVISVTQVPLMPAASMPIRIVATDSKNMSSVLIPTVTFCSCQSSIGQCDYRITYVLPFTKVSCVCDNIRQDGESCKKIFSMCKTNICYPSSSCSEGGTGKVKCGTCPNGMINENLDESGMPCIRPDRCGRSLPCGGFAQYRYTAPSYRCRCSSQGPGNFYDHITRTCKDIDECISGDATCSEDRGTVCTNEKYTSVHKTHSCACKPGFAITETTDPKKCEDIDECTKVPPVCPTNSWCLNTPGSYTCHCNQGFRMNHDTKQCEEFNLCDIQHNCSQVCRKGNKGTYGTYSCRCDNANAFSPQSDAVTCKPKAQYECDSSEKALCDGGNARSICIKDDKNGGISCRCPRGFHSKRDNSGTYTCSDMDECLSSPCDVRTSDCKNTVGSFECVCKTGYESALSKRLCLDIDECAKGTHNCNASSVCVNSPGGFYCKCPDGSNMEGNICEDINECISDWTNKCDKENGVCENKSPGYSCKCKDGFDGNGLLCTGVETCNMDERKACPPYSACTKSPGDLKPTCTCYRGYRMSFGNCTDIDECSEPGTPCVNQLATCRNLVPGFECICKTGYTGNGVICEDINECQTGTHECDKRPAQAFVTEPRASCHNTNGSYVCTCYPGFKQGTDGKTCNDIDECQQGIHNCSYGCENTEGSYKCTCPNGLLLDRDMRSCFVDKPCVLRKDCEHICVKVNGQEKCQCPAGFTIATDDKSCRNIDECVEFQSTNGPCDDIQGVCEDTTGSFKCSCRSQHQLGPNNECKDRDGSWTEWAIWSPCSGGCHGSRTRKRLCINPRPAGKGAPCPGSGTEKKPCQNTCTYKSYSSKALLMKFETAAKVTPYMWSCCIASALRHTVSEAVRKWCDTDVATGCKKPNQIAPKKEYKRTIYLDPIAGFPVFGDKKLEVGFTVSVKGTYAECFSSTSMASTDSTKSLSYEEMFGLLNDEKSKSNLMTATMASLKNALKTNFDLKLTSVGRIWTPATSPLDTTPAPTTDDPTKKTDNILYIAIGAAVGGVVLIVIIIVLSCKYCGRKGSNSVNPAASADGSERYDRSEMSHGPSTQVLSVDEKSSPMPPEMKDCKSSGQTLQVIPTTPHPEEHNGLPRVDVTTPGGHIALQEMNGK
ncbi:uncharacterized protein LOC135491680 [Lineus longissimus]|uniref:uncharacterized protein LOC135491680 n=1 Tax=Lineus longissimus TaxID=88925 RepID=UPI00315CBC2E